MPALEKLLLVAGWARAKPHDNKIEQIAKKGTFIFSQFLGMTKLFCAVKQKYITLKGRTRTH